MTAPDHQSSTSNRATTAEVAREIAVEQAHVDVVYAELAKAKLRAGLVETDGLARGRTDRTGDVRDEELTGLFERDALVFNAARRRSTLDTQFEGLVFGRLDLDHALSKEGADSDRETRYIGRLGVRDDDYEPLVVDWRAPAAAAFYRATPVEPMDVLRRRVLRCKGPDVVGVEDDLMVAEAPDDLVVVGDGALLAALTRSRGAQMRDIVATIQRHQDEAIRASARGITEITGGPGTGKTVVALHRAAYLLYSDRRRFENGGILVVGPSSAYTAYIERVLPSLGEESVTLRSLGDVVDGVTAVRLDSPQVAAVKGSLRVRRLLSRAAADSPPGAPTQFRAFVGGNAVRIDTPALDRIRAQVLRSHQRNLSAKAVRAQLAEAAWNSVREGDRGEFMDHFEDHLEVDAFLERWWPQVDPREVLLWLADPELATRHGRGVLTASECEAFAASMREALRTGTWSVADAALVDDLAARMGSVQEAAVEERGFYEIEELDDVSQFGVAEVRATRQSGAGSANAWSRIAVTDPRERLLQGRVEGPGEYAHVLVDEAQDLSPMQWRMLGRRGRYSSWTVVGDAAQASWPDAAESGRAREEAFGTQARRLFHMDTNYRNAREIFDYAAAVVKAQVPDADIPQAVRETGAHPLDLTVGDGDWAAVATEAVEVLLGEVEGSIAVITPERHHSALAAVGELGDRVVVIDPMSTKGLEYDATVVVDPDEITAESPGGVRVLYVALTRAAHRMTVLRPA
ncbi:AAA family ATPase [Phycicoccus sp. Root101]|uniref:HelD family protein n=1 Tax=Phycicoccus sp. Root101 TaxID=1736421 RepID=UPI000702652E|nr:AAA family ATPase [Phycicoccus sp. Root101]KQU68025.1 helicase [Phycicoccus sp. Root101]